MPQSTKYLGIGSIEHFKDIQNKIVNNYWKLYKRTSENGIIFHACTLEVYSWLKWPFYPISRHSAIFCACGKPGFDPWHFLKINSLTGSSLTSNSNHFFLKKIWDIYENIDIESVKSWSLEAFTDNFVKSLNTIP